MTSEIAQLRQQLSGQQQADTNKQVDKLEKDLQTKKVEIVTLRDKVTIIKYDE